MLHFYSLIIICISIITLELNTYSSVMSNAQHFRSRPYFNFSEIIQINKQTTSSVPNRCPLRIVGGMDAPIYYVPYQVAISVPEGPDWQVWCGGTLVTLIYVITAAHCFDGEDTPKISSTTVVAGSTRALVTNVTEPHEQIRRPKYYFKHRDYDPVEFHNDIGVFEVLDAFTESDTVKPIRMHTEDLDFVLKEKMKCITSGFGALETDGEGSPTLQMVCVPLVNYKVCRKFYNKDAVTRNHVCAGELNKDSCQGDSGGPLVCHGIFVGIVSFGRVCGESMGVYTRLSSYTDVNNPPSFVESKNKCGIARVDLPLLLMVILVLFW